MVILVKGNPFGIFAKYIGLPGVDLTAGIHFTANLQLLYCLYPFIRDDIESS